MARLRVQSRRRSRPVGSEVFDPEEQIQVYFSQCFTFSMIDLDEQFDPPMVPASVSFPPGTPDWVNEDLVRDTIETWQQFSRQPLTPDATLAVLLNFIELLDTAMEDD